MYDFYAPPGERVISESIRRELDYCNKGVVFRTVVDGSWNNIVDWLDEVWEETHVTSVNNQGTGDSKVRFESDILGWSVEEEIENESN